MSDKHETGLNWSNHPIPVFIGLLCTVVATVVAVATFLRGNDKAPRPSPEEPTVKAAEHVAEADPPGQRPAPPPSGPVFASDRDEVERWLRDAQAIMARFDLRRMNDLRVNPEAPDQVEREIAQLRAQEATTGFRAAPKLYDGWTIQSVSERSATVLTEIELTVQARVPRTGNLAYVRSAGRRRWTLTKVTGEWKLLADEPIGELRVLEQRERP